MAIHIRPRKALWVAENKRRMRMRIAASASALALIIIVGALLYHFIIILPQRNNTSFIAYTPPVEETPFEDAPQAVEISAAAASAAQDIMPEIIIATGVSTVQISVPDFASDGDFGGMSVGIGDGIGPTSLGDGTGMGLGTGSGSGTGSKGGGGKHGKGSNDDIQVVLLLDASGSMDQLFVEAAGSMEQLLTALNSCRLNGRPAKVNLGIVAYGAAKGNGAPWTISKFSKDVKNMRKRLSEVACDGSEEHCGVAIQYAVNEFPWNMRERDQILKVIFIAGNETFDQGPVHPEKAIKQATDKGIILNTIVCGGPDQSWTDAAKQGGGEAFAIDIQSGGGTTPGERLAAVKALYNCEVIPTGSPADIERCEKELRKRDRLPNEQSVDKWVSKNQVMLVNGFEWDAVELCRRMDSEFTLDVVGGLGNLPEKFRAMGEDRALDYIRDAASARQDAIDAYKEKMSGGGDFCNAALEALRKQAAAKGIDIEL